MKRKEVNMAEHRSGSDDTLAVLIQVCTESLNESIAVDRAAWRNIRVERLRNSSPGVFFQNADDLGRLYVFFISASTRL